jgi:hypothetical protein
MLGVSFEEAARRVAADPDRSVDAMSRGLDFLRSTHEAVAVVPAALPPVDLEIDTDERSATEVADQVLEFLLA